jgi:hypothetical protein
MDITQENYLSWPKRMANYLKQPRLHLENSIQYLIGRVNPILSGFHRLSVFPDRIFQGADAFAHLDMLLGKIDLAPG